MRPRAEAWRAASRLTALIVTVAAACALVGCTGSSPAARQKSACQQHCGEIAALVASAEEQCPDPGMFATAACRTWASKVVSVGRNWIYALPAASINELNSGLDELEGFHDEGCAGKSPAAGASVLNECQAQLVRGIIDLRLAREGMAGGRAPDVLPTSGADNWWALGVAVAPVSSALARLRRASTSAQVSAGLVAVDAAAQAADGVLDGAAPALPADSRAQNDLATALAELSTQLKPAEPGMGSCGVPAPALGGLSAVGTGTAYTRDLPKAIREMAAAGSPVPLVLPVMPVQYNRRLGTGMLILDAATGGLGELGITGSAVSDAVIELVASGRPVVEVYVQAGTGPHIHGIPDGSYVVYVETGADWDSAAKSFTRGCQYQKFDPPLYFQTTASTSTIYTIGVDKDIAGNTSVTPVSGLPR
jgi:hypothetical protein